MVVFALLYIFAGSGSEFGAVPGNLGVHSGSVSGGVPCRVQGIIGLKQDQSHARQMSSLLDYFSSPKLFVCSAQIFSVLLWEPHLSVLSSDSGSVLEDHVILKIKSGPPTRQACAQPSESSSEPSAYLGGG